MIVDIVMPKMGESITEGTILEWRKEVGDQIDADEILLEIGTDKVDSEIPSPTGGVITELLAHPNDVIEVGKTIARIETEIGAVSMDEPPREEPVSKPTPEPSLPQPPTPAPEIKVQNVTIGQSEPASGTKKYYTPIVKSIARKEGISDNELASLSGTGHNGRVTKRDLLAYIEIRKSTPPVVSQAPVKEVPDIFPEHEPSAPSLIDERKEMTKMRRIIAEHMRHSLDTAAHVHLMNEVDMTSIVRYIETHGNKFKSREGFSLTVTPFIVSACVRALQSFPDMNSSVEGSTIIHKKNINIGLAVAVDDGLMVPVIPRCEELNFLGLCRKIRDLAIRTRSKKLMPEELTGSTFSISNFGIFNVTAGTPIINQPNVGILGVGTIQKKPVVIETNEGDTIGIRSMMILSLGFDHRLIDGAGGARFIEMVLNQLEQMDLTHLF